VKVRIRNPILTKQVEQVQEKWLVIDHFQWIMWYLFTVHKIPFLWCSFNDIV
jgi:hypothetical protein